MLLTLLCFFLAGCLNQKIENDPELFYVEPYTVLSKTQIKTKDPVHKFQLLEEFELDIPGNIVIKDSLAKNKNAYFLANGKLARVNLADMRTRITDLDRSANWDTITDLNGTMAIYQKGKSSKLLLIKDNKTTVHNFSGLISSVFPHNKYIMVIMTNGLCVCYDPDQSEEVWRSVAHNQYKHGLKSSALFQDNIIFVEPLGRLVLIDIDNGTIKEYRNIGTCSSNSNVSVQVMQDGFCAMVDENLLVASCENGELKYNKLRFEGLKSVKAKGNYLIIEKPDYYLITTIPHLFNKKFISQIAKTGQVKDIFVHKKSICTVDNDGANFYRINSGALIQRITSDKKVQYSALNAGKLFLLANKKISVYN